MSVLHCALYPGIIYSRNKMRGRAIGVTFFFCPVKYHLKLSSEQGVEVNRETKQAMDTDIKLPQSLDIINS